MDFKAIIILLSEIITVKKSGSIHNNWNIHFSFSPFSFIKMIKMLSKYQVRIRCTEFGYSYRIKTFRKTESGSCEVKDPDPQLNSRSLPPILWSWQIDSTRVFVRWLKYYSSASRGVIRNARAPPWSLGAYSGVYSGSIAISRSY